MILVTGVAGLIGADVADVLTERGMAVVGVDRVEVGTVEVGTVGTDTVGVDQPSGRWSRVMRVDLTDEAAVRHAAETVRGEYGGLDAIVHAAAMTGRSRELAPHTLRTVDLTLWRRVVEVNLTGALVCAREFGALLRPGPLAQILMVGSVQGLVPTMGASAYAVSKAALSGLVRQLAAEFAADGVRVNLVAPGPVADEAEIARLRATGADEAPTPLARFGRPRELAAAIADLVTGSFALMTGAVIPVDGGEHLRPRTGPKRAHGE